MSFRVILYCLKPDLEGNTILSYELNSDKILISNNLENVVVKLNDKLFTISKAIYMNRKIFDYEKGFLFMANKQVRPEYVFEKLLDYAITKLDTRALKIASARDRYVKELNDHRKLVAA